MKQLFFALLFLPLFSLAQQTKIQDAPRATSTGLLDTVFINQGHVLKQVPIGLLPFTRPSDLNIYALQSYVNSQIAAIPNPLWSNIQSKPSSFPPSAHTHVLSDLLQSGATNGQVPSWNGTAWVAATVSGSGATIAATTGIIKGDGVGNGIAATAGIDFVPPSAQYTSVSGTTYTLLSTDNSKVIVTTSSSPVTITIPTGLPIGTNIGVLQKGLGAVTVAAGGGVTLINAASSTSGPGTMISIISTGTTNEYRD